MKRTLARGSVLLAAAALATSVLVIAPAGAAAPQQSCKTLKGSATITPGLSTTAHAQTVAAKGTLAGCTPAKTTGGSAPSFKATLKLPANSSCQGLLKGGQTIKIPAASVTWKNKKTSTLALSAKTGTGSKATVATITGKVSKGLFAGHAVTASMKITPAKGQDCISKPVKNLTFTNPTPFVIK